MTIDLLWQAFSTSQKPAIYHKDDAAFIASLVDLTLLDYHASSDQITALCEKASRYNVAALCVYPQHLTYCNKQLPSFKKATVVNFPSGEQDIKDVLMDIDRCIVEFQADEIDYVFPYQTYLNGNTNNALQHYQQALTHCKQQQVTFKVIMETGAFESLQTLYELSCTLLEFPCDFLKTSTGKIATGATPAAAFCLLTAIANRQSPCGIKISGGIKTPEQAQIYIDMATQILKKLPDNHGFRIGASSLLDAL